MTTRDLYQIEQFPVFQNRMYNTKQEALLCPRGNIRLVENLQTGLIYNADFMASLMNYDQSYQNEQAISPNFRQHLSHVASIIEMRMKDLSVVEIGCGKGYFLEMLLAKNLNLVGYDPTYEGNNPRIFKQYFTSKIGIQAEGLILRHVLEHIQNPINFLKEIQEINGGSGIIYIEVPCFDWICEHKAWFDIFYEHVNYFRLCDFYRMFDTIYESGRFFGGQYIYIIADLATLKTPKYKPSDSVKFPMDFISKMKTPPHNQNQFVIWGGASKGVIFALLKERMGTPVTHVIDINPAKQNKYLPATGLRVQSPEDVLPQLDAGTAIFVMNSNYLDEIKQMSGNFFNYFGVDYE